MSLGPFDMTGGSFLILYLVLLVLTVVAGLAIPRWLRPEGRRQVVTDEDQLAYLSGGAARFGDALVARLLAARSLAMTGKDEFGAAPHAAGASAAEAGILALPQPIRWHEIDRTLKSHARPLGRKLTDAGLLVGAAERASLARWAVLPYALLLGFGAIKLLVGIARDKPVGFLAALLIATFVLALIRYFTIDRRTRAGVHALNDAKLRAARLKGAPTNAEMGLAVALFGTAVLVGSGFDDFHKLRSPSSDGGSSSGDSGSDGGGCGGGGCGGCGGGD